MIAVLGIDLGKTVFSLAGLDKQGGVVLRKRVRRWRVSCCRSRYGRPIGVAASSGQASSVALLRPIRLHPVGAVWELRRLFKCPLQMTFC